LEAGAEGAKQSEPPDSTKGLSEHMFGEQVFVLGKPYIVIDVIRQVLGKPNNVTKFTKIVLDKGN
jgi:hypothetical protein